MWPLNYYFFNEWHLKTCLKANLGMFMLFFGIAMIFIIYSNLFLWKALVLFLGLWLWSLAETAGDSYRHLSSKTDTSWKIERWMIHSVLFSFVMTIAVIFSFLSNNPEMSFVTKDHFIWEVIF
jgi:hypothetical protein